MRDPDLAARARQLRLNQTPAERAVWQALRAEPFKDLHFRGQVAFENRCIADFASHRAKLIVEVDGPSHALTGEADEARTRWLEAQGYRVVRIANADIHNRSFDLAAVLAALIKP